jgi:hypothetical protein
VTCNVALFWVSCLAIICFALLAEPRSAREAIAASITIPPGQPATDWSFAASVYTYIVPDSHNYAQPTLKADRGWLHLEARYNYEALETGSLWVGYNFSASNKLSLNITPMLGGVFGKTTGVAPGLRGSLSWWRFYFYGEGEFVITTDKRSDSFLYGWSELTVSPFDWLRAGLVLQKTKVYQSDFNVQRGFLVGVNYKKVEVTGYVFNPDKKKPTFVTSVSIEF